MNFNLVPFTAFWIILAIVVIGLVLYRKWVIKDEGDRLHLRDSERGMLARQIRRAQKLESIDRWGKSLTAITLVYGFAVGSGYAYQSWMAAAKELFR